MSELRHYLVHGLTVASPVELPIPETQPIAPTGTHTADIAYRIAPTAAPVLPVPLHTRSDDPDGPWFQEHWTDAGLIIEFPGAASFRVALDEIVLLSDDADDADLVAHLLLDHVMPRLVSFRGDLMLHASGVVGPSGRAHLFLGPSGTGKSTLATALAGAGWPLLDDDGIRVVERGTWHAVPGYPGLRLRADSAAAAAPRLAPSRPMSRAHAKFRYELEDPMRIAGGPTQIGRIHLLVRSHRNEIWTTDIPFADAITSLCEHAFHLADEPTDITRQAFERAAAVATAVDMDQLTVPDGLDRLATVIEALVRLDQQVS